MYKLCEPNLRGEHDQVKRLTDFANIPFDPANTDYANFKKDLADGAELLDSEGNVIDGIAYLATLED
jgi:hypothetical protein